jgi:hypothetical protein
MTALLAKLDDRLGPGGAPADESAHTRCLGETNPEIRNHLGRASLPSYSSRSSGAPPASVPRRGSGATGRPAARPSRSSTPDHTEAIHLVNQRRRMWIMAGPNRKMVARVHSTDSHKLSASSPKMKCAAAKRDNEYAGVWLTQSLLSAKLVVAQWVPMCPCSTVLPAVSDPRKVESNPGKHESLSDPGDIPRSRESGNSSRSCGSDSSRARARLRRVVAVWQMEP